MKTGIYKITNLVNGKFYIGSSLNLAERWRRHRNKLRQGTHENEYLQQSWNKHKEENFTFDVIEEIEFGDVYKREFLINREQFYLDTTKCCDRTFGYNICPTANSCTHSEETKRKISLSKKGKPSKTKGRPRTAEHCANISKALKGKKLTDEVCRKMSLSHTGKSSGFLGHKHSDESKAAMSERNSGSNNPFYGKKHSEETKTKFRLREEVKRQKKENVVAFKTGWAA